MVPWKNNIWKVTQSFQVIWKSPKESSLQFLEEVCQILRELLVWSNACPLSHWCHPTILSSVVPFSFCLPSFPASGTFPMSWLFTSGGQSTGASVSASVLPVSIQVNTNTVICPYLNYLCYIMITKHIRKWKCPFSNGAQRMRTLVEWSILQSRNYANFLGY